MGTLITGVILAIIIITAVSSYIKQLKKGGCGCGCSGCSRKCAENRNEDE